MRPLYLTLIEGIGFLSILFGAFLISPIIALIAAGFGLIYLAWLMERGKHDDNQPND